MRVKEYCKLPPLRWYHRKREGMVCACSCGKLYRMHLVGAAGSAFWMWESVKETND